MTFQGQTRTKKKTGTWFWVLFSPDLSYSWPVRELLLNAWHLYCSVASEVAQSCPILCDPIDCSPPGSSVHGILQARIMELVAILLSRVQLFVTVWTAACQASLFFTISQSLLKLISIESVMPSNHLILSSPPPVFASITIFSDGSVLHIRWPKYWSFSFSISPSNEYSGLISFRIDWSISICYKESPSLFSPTPAHSQLFSGLDCSINSHACNCFSQNLGSSFILLSLIYPSANLADCTSKYYMYMLCYAMLSRFSRVRLCATP